MLNKETVKAYWIFIRIASSNKRTNLDELETIRPLIENELKFKSKEVESKETKVTRTYCEMFKKVLKEFQIRSSRLVIFYFH